MLTNSTRNRKLAVQTKVASGQMHRVMACFGTPGLCDNFSFHADDGLSNVQFVKCKREIVSLFLRFCMILQ